MTSSYVDSLHNQARASVWAGASWAIAEADSTLRDIEAVETKLRVIDRARTTGLTWPAVAESVRYGDTGDPDDTVDWIRAGKALQAWHAHHANDPADHARDEARQAALADKQRAEIQLDAMDDIAASIVTNELAADAQ